MPLGAERGGRKVPRLRRVADEANPPRLPSCYAGPHVARRRAAHRVEASRAPRPSILNPATRLAVSGGSSPRANRREVLCVAASGHRRTAGDLQGMPALRRVAASLQALRLLWRLGPIEVAQQAGPGERRVPRQSAAVGEVREGNAEVVGLAEQPINHPNHRQRNPNCRYQQKPANELVKDVAGHVGHYS